MAGAWEIQWAQLGHDLTWALRPDAVTTIHIPFGCGAAASTKELFDKLNERQLFTGRNALQYLESLDAVLSPWANLPSVVAFRAAYQRYFSFRTERILQATAQLTALESVTLEVVPDGMSARVDRTVLLLSEDVAGVSRVLGAPEHQVQRVTIHAGQSSFRCLQRDWDHRGSKVRSYFVMKMMPQSTLSELLQHLRPHFVLLIGTCNGTLYPEGSIFVTENFRGEKLPSEISQSMRTEMTRVNEQVKAGEEFLALTVSKHPQLEGMQQEYLCRVLGQHTELTETALKQKAEADGLKLDDATFQALLAALQPRYITTNGNKLVLTPEKRQTITEAGFFQERGTPRVQVPAVIADFAAEAEDTAGKSQGLWFIDATAVHLARVINAHNSVLSQGAARAKYLAVRTKVERSSYIAYGPELAAAWAVVFQRDYCINVKYELPVMPAAVSPPVQLPDLLAAPLAIADVPAPLRSVSVLSPAATQLPVDPSILLPEHIDRHPAVKREIINMLASQAGGWEGLATRLSAGFYQGTITQSWIDEIKERTVAIEWERCDRFMGALLQLAPPIAVLAFAQACEEVNYGLLAYRLQGRAPRATAVVANTALTTTAARPTASVLTVTATGSSTQPKQAPPELENLAVSYFYNAYNCIPLVCRVHVVTEEGTDAVATGTGFIYGESGDKCVVITAAQVACPDPESPPFAIQLVFFKDNLSAKSECVEATLAGRAASPQRLADRSLPDATESRLMFAILTCDLAEIQRHFPKLAVPQVYKMPAEGKRPKSVNLIHHGESKFVSLKAKIRHITDTLVTYELSVKEGDPCGAPIFSDTWHLLGIHIGGTGSVKQAVRMDVIENQIKQLQAVLPAPLVRHEPPPFASVRQLVK